MRYIIMLALLLVALLWSVTPAEDNTYYLEEIPIAVPDGPDFPRLAMWYADERVNKIEECAAYDVLVGKFHEESWSEEGTFGEVLKRNNPDIVLLSYFTNAVIRYTDIYHRPNKINPYVRDWPARWFLTEAGAELAVPIDDKQTVIRVSKWQQTGEAKGRRPKEWEIFRVGYDVQCEGEIMRITGTNPDKMQITVERGLNGTEAKVHHADVRIAPLLRFWSGSYIMNLSTDCPTAKLHGASKEESWAEYSFRTSMSAVDEWFWYTGGEQDGFLFDLMADTISWVMWADTRSIDLDRDNVADEFEYLDQVWLEGINLVTEMFHEEWPGKPILRNQSRGRRMAEYNGENFESWPRDGWQYEDLDASIYDKTKYWHRQFIGDSEEERGGILDFINMAAAPNYTLISTAHAETDLDTAGLPEIVIADPLDLFRPDLQKMRWGLTSALIAGAYYCFVVHTDGHGQRGLLWFDEYDKDNERNGEGRGYLGQPVSGVLKLAEHKDEYRQKENYRSELVYGIWGREYEHGFVICNPLDYEADVPLPPGLWQRLTGEQDRAVNSGVFEEGSVRVGEFDGLILLRVENTSTPGAPQTPESVVVQ